MKNHISPAPWKLSEDDEHKIVDCRGERVAHFNNYRILGPGQDAENKRLYYQNCANAKMAVRAPEMVVLIKQFIEMFGEIPHLQTYYQGYHDNATALLKEIENVESN